jgi:antitoxin CcdA
MSYVYDTTAPKKATNLTINSDLLKKSKKYKINLSQNFEQYLEAVVRQKTQEEWEKENKKAIDAYNNDVAKNGVFSDGLRSF